MSAATRRELLGHSGALAAAVALPAGGFMALPAAAGMIDDQPLVDGPALGADDPGLAQLEAGYARWRALQVEMHRLARLAADLSERAEAAMAPMLTPKPVRSPEIVEWITEDGLFTRGLDAVPPALRQKVDGHYGAMIRHQHACNDILADHPDTLAMEEADRKSEQLDREAWALRAELLQIPTTSPRGLLIKLLVAFEASDLSELETQAVNEDNDDFAAAFARGVVNDLRSMAGVEIVADRA